MSVERGLPGEGIGVVEGGGTAILIEAIDERHVLGSELKMEDIEILLEMVGLGTGDGDETTLDDPSEHDLRRGLAIARGYLLEKRMAGHVDVALTKGGPTHNLDTKLTIVGCIVHLRHEGMYLYLIDHRSYLGIGEKVVKVIGIEIAHTDGAHLALTNKRLHDLPSVLDTVAYRPVDEQEVHIVHLQTRQAVLYALANGLCTFTHEVGIYLGGEEDVLTRDTTEPYALTYFLLILVHLSGIDVTKTSLKSQFDILYAGIALECPSADTHLGNGKMIG